MGLLTGGGGFGTRTASSPPQQGPSSTRPGPISQYPVNPPQQGPSDTMPGPISQYPVGTVNPQQAAEGVYGYDRALVDQALAYLQQRRALSGLQQNARDAGYGIDNAYADRQAGFANRGADLARQLLGLDRQDLGINRQGLGLDRRELGINRADYQRQWGMDKWALGNDLAARGAFVTPGSRTQHADLTQRLQNAMAGFDVQGNRIDLEGNRLDVEGNRIGVRENQVGLNLEEQLAGYQNRKDQNNASSRYGSATDALTNLGIDQEIAQALVSRAQVDSNIAALIAQVMASNPQPES